VVDFVNAVMNLWPSEEETDILSVAIQLRMDSIVWCGLHVEFRIERLSGPRAELSLLLRKSGSAGNRTRDLWIFSQEL
jgi:hypothetical protein